MITINDTVTWKGQPYTVTGYCMVGEKLTSLWIVNERGVEYKLRGKQLRQVKHG